MTVRAQIEYLDEDSQKASHGVYLKDTVEATTNADFQALLAAIAACSAAAIPYVSLIKGSEQTTALDVGNPYDCEDKARLQFVDADGNQTSFFLPAPLRVSGTSPADVFLNDDDTVDRLSSPVADLISEIAAFAVTVAAKALVDYINGKRTRKNRKS